MSDSPESRVQAASTIIAAKLDPLLHQIAGERMGFALVVFPLNRTGEIKAVSNVKRGQFEPILATMLEEREEFYVPTAAQG